MNSRKRLGRNCQQMTTVGFFIALAIAGVAYASGGTDTGEVAESKALTQSEREEILKRVSWRPPDASFLWNDQMAQQLLADYAGRPFVPFLCEIVEDDTMPYWSRCTAMVVLGNSRDARGIPAIRSVIDRPLKEDMSNDEWHLIHTAILCLGMTADDPALDLLFEMAKEDYWLARNPRAAKRDSSPESFRDHMRLMALNGIANSGSERAIHAFTTKEGVPDDKQAECEWLLNLAVRRSKDLKGQQAVSRTCVGGTSAAIAAALFTGGLWMRRRRKKRRQP